MARAKKRGFVNRVLGTYCTDFYSKNKKSTKTTNKIIRKRLKRWLQKEIEETRE